ncbi:MAG: RNA polymerase-binding protein DksA [Pseudomonadota bacterium]
MPENTPRKQAQTAVKSKAASKAQAAKTKTPTRDSQAKSKTRKKSTGVSKAGKPDLIFGVAPYQPKKGEAYMSDSQLEHFRTILENWKHELMQEVDRTIHHMQDDAGALPDANDRATQEAEFGLELKTRDRERKLIRKIDAALERISLGDYGYCENTGEEIGLDRLEARPIATLCLEAQQRYEIKERHFGSRNSEG